MAKPTRERRVKIPEESGTIAKLSARLDAVQLQSCSSGPRCARPRGQR